MPPLRFAAIAIFLFAGAVLAQDPPADEDGLYRIWHEAQAAGNLPRAVEAAGEFLKQFPHAKNAAYLKEKWLPTAYAKQFNEATQARDCGTMVAVAKSALAFAPDQLDYLYLSAIALRQNELFASPARFEHAADGADFSRRAIKLIEAGQAPTTVPKEKWSAPAALAVLYQTLAFLEVNTQQPDPAAEHYHKSTELETDNRALVMYNTMACGAIHNAKYVTAQQKYLALPGKDRESSTPPAEVKAALDEVNRFADAVIDCWARFLALTAAKNPYGAKRDEIQKVLAKLYPYRHPDEPEGLVRLVEKLRPAEKK